MSRERGHDGMVSGYPTSTSLPRVDGLSTDPWVLGHHIRGAEAKPPWYGMVQGI